MKTARTFTIDTELAKDLRQKQNQSQFVEDAIKAKMYPSSQPKHILEYAPYELLFQVMKYFEKDSLQWKLLHDMWESEYKKHSTSSNPDANP